MDAACPVSKPYGVVKSDSGKLVSCHPTEAEAMAKMKAMYANMPMEEK